MSLNQLIVIYGAHLPIFLTECFVVMEAQVGMVLKFVSITINYFTSSVTDNGRIDPCGDIHLTRCQSRETAGGKAY